MHLCTSAISRFGSVDKPDRFPPQMLSSSTIPEVNTDIYPNEQQGNVSHLSLLLR